jgi:glycosyltransferase involved in cell wall biosynthesis
MQIVHIIPGSGGSFYCGNCLRDSKYFSSIKKLGHDVLKIPMYLPLFSHDTNNEDVPIFYGAVNLYLKQTYPLFKKAPKWFDNILNTRPVLKQAAKMAGSTRAKGLEEMTISMLLGEHGDQAEELEKMIRWLENHYRPDVIHLSNALLLGLAGRLKSRLGVPVVCSLQDEDVWVDVMSETSREAVWNLMSEKAEDVAAFVSVSHYFTKLMKEKMTLDDKKVHTLHLGVDPDDYTFINSAEKKRAIGYLSRMNECNGLDILVDAFILLKNDKKNHDVRLYLSGGYTGDDHQFIKKQKKKIIEAGVSSDVFFLENFENEHRHIFFERVSLLSVPVRNGEAFGIYLAEAMASGIPVVQPPVGAFPEIVEITGGGVTSSENTSGKLAEALGKVLDDKKMLQELSTSARKGVGEKLNINTQASKLMDIYRGI